MVDKSEYKFTLVLIKNKFYNVYYSVESAKAMRSLEGIGKHCKILEVTCESFDKVILVINHFMICQRSHNLAPINYNVLERVFGVKIEEIA